MLAKKATQVRDREMLRTFSLLAVRHPADVTWNHKTRETYSPRNGSRAVADVRVNGRGMHVMARPPPPEAPDVQVTAAEVAAAAEMAAAAAANEEEAAAAVAGRRRKQRPGGSLGFRNSAPEVTVRACH